MVCAPQPAPFPRLHHALRTNGNSFPHDGNAIPHNRNSLPVAHRLLCLCTSWWTEGKGAPGVAGKRRSHADLPQTAGITLLPCVPTARTGARRHGRGTHHRPHGAKGDGFDGFDGFDGLNVLGRSQHARPQQGGTRVQRNPVPLSDTVSAMIAFVTRAAAVPVGGFAEAYPSIAARHCVGVQPNRVLKARENWAWSAKPNS